MIHKSFNNELDKYMIPIHQNFKHKMLANYALSDPIHMLVSLYTDQPIPNFLWLVKSFTLKWANENGFIFQTVGMVERLKSFFLFIEPWSFRDSLYSEEESPDEIVLEKILKNEALRIYQYIASLQ